MNRFPATLVALTALAAALTGCLMDDRDRESTAEGDADARRMTLDMPDGATSLRIDVDARAQSGEPDVTILLEDEAGNNLASDTFSVSGSTSRSVSANVDGQDRIRVTVRVVDGDASLDVRATAFVPGQPEVVVIRETIVVGVAPPVATSPAQPTPSPTPTPPTATPPATPTPASPTPATNTTPTNSTNATG